MNKIFILTSLLLCSTIWTKASDFKFGKVSKEEVAETQHPLEVDAKSAVLYQETKVYIEYNSVEEAFEMVTEVFKRVKIYDATDADLGTIAIRFYSYKNEESISKIKGITYNYEDGKIVETKLDSKTIYEEESSKYYSSKKFAMPGIKKGSVFEFKYTHRSPFFFKIDKTFIQSDIPYNQILYSTRVPEYFNYNVNTTGVVPLEVEKSSIQKRLTFTYIRDNFRSFGAEKKMETQTVNFIEHTTIYTTKNIPSLKDEDFVPYMNNYRASIEHELLYTDYPNDARQFYTKTWDDIADNLDQDFSFGQQLRGKTKGLDDLLAEVEGSTNEEKAISFFNIVKNHFTWNKEYRVTCETSLKDAIQSKSGSIADINLLLIKGLNELGLTAFPVVTRARNNGFLNISAPTRSDINYVFVYLDLDGKDIFLDASTKGILFGQLPPRALNLKGAVIMEKKGQLIDIPNPNKSKNQKIITATIDDDNPIKIESQAKYKGYSSVQIMGEYQQYKDTEEWMEELEADDENVAYESIEVKSENLLAKGTTLKKNYTLEGCTEMIDGKLYIDAMLDQAKKSNPFTESTRTVPIFYNSTMNQVTTIQLAIPDGYEVETLPEEAVIALPEQAMVFSYSAKAMGNVLTIQSRFERKADMIVPELYESLKEFYDIMVTKGKEKIVLKKL